MTSKNVTRLLYLALTLFIGWSLTFYVLQCTSLFQRVLHGNEHIHMPFTVDDDLLTIGDLTPEARSAGLRSGDRLLELRGEPYRNRRQIVEIQGGAATHLRPGDPLDVAVRHTDGVVAHTRVWTTAGVRLAPQFAWITISSTLFPLACLLIGYWVAAARIRDPHAWLLLVLFAVPSAISTSPFWWSGPTFYWQLGWYSLLQFLAAPALMVFGIYFPERWRVDQRAPWAKWLILAPIALGTVLILTLIWMEYEQAARLGLQAAALSRWLDLILRPLSLICVAIYIVALVDKLRSATTADARRRMQVLTAGSLVGIGALLAIFILLPQLGLQPEKHLWLASAGFFLFFAAPFSFAYVVVVQRALDVRILLRMGTKYALARATLVTVEIAIVAFVFFRFLLPLFLRRESLPLAIGATVLAAIIGIRLFAARDSISHRIQRSLDRRFFREAYDAELVLSELSEQARRYTEAGPLVDVISRRIADVLHVSQLAVYLRHGRSFGVERCIGLDGEVPKRFEESSSTVRNLARSNQPARLYRENPDGWYLLADDREREGLGALKTELLLPLTGRERLLGFLSLGPKRSEEPYTPSDLRLLQSVGTQAGLALEISTLVHSLASEAARRERIDREIEIAREVQERLFPQQIPSLPGISLHGACRPAQGVGGDYYDILTLDGDRLGLAIGDVSGKGISAALLMASLRASLRGMTMQNPDDLALLMSRVNRLVYESSATNRYATFFFGIYDPATRLLRYVNAGHNPPYVVRGSELHALEGGGPVIGLLPEAEYEECEITLEVGDLLLAYTDGISEALNTQEQEWGEERMVAAARERLPDDAGTILRHIVNEADRFAASAPQHDDMTLLLMKLQTA